MIEKKVQEFQFNLLVMIRRHPLIVNYHKLVVAEPYF